MLHYNQNDFTFILTAQLAIVALIPDQANGVHCDQDHT